MRAGRRERGYTLAGAFLLIAALGAGMAAYGEIASHAAQREKEQELLFIGREFRQAIAAYYERTPGAVKRYPQKIEELLDDRRHAVPERYLRRIYADPMTGRREWGLVQAPEGGIMGVHSLSEATPIKTGGFEARDEALAGAERYADWRFIHTPSVWPASRQRGETPSAPSG